MLDSEILGLRFEVMVFQKPQKFISILSEKEQVSSKVYRLVFDLGDQRLSFHAGQTLMIHVSDKVNRAMSIGSPPQEQKITIYDDISPMGPLSHYIIDRKVGDQIYFMAPLGRFVLDKTNNRKKILVATGTGLAPFIAMTADYYVTGGSAPITIYFGVRYKEDIFLAEKLAEYKQKFSHFNYILTLSKPADDWKGERGRVTDQVFSKETDLLNSDIYLCGNRAMVEEMKAKLYFLGVPETQVKTELYY